jgi:type II secretory pathway pseudopilin PulG
MDRKNRLSPHDRTPAMGGFTFVEIIVVGIIVAILAAVSIPIYSGYVTYQRNQAATSVAQTASVTANSIFRRLGAGHPTTAELVAAFFLPNAAQFTITVSGNQVNVAENSNPSIPVSVSVQFRP